MEIEDNRCIHIASNWHEPHRGTIVNRKDKKRVITQVTSPDIVKDYNFYMNSVDTFDQIWSTVFEIKRKSTKWWHRMFLYFIDLCIPNAFVLYKLLENTDKTMKSVSLIRKRLSENGIRDTEGVLIAGLLKRGWNQLYVHFLHNSALFGKKSQQRYYYLSWMKSKYSSFLFHCSLLFHWYAMMHDGKEFIPDYTNNKKTWNKCKICFYYIFYEYFMRERINNIIIYRLWEF